jgi:hypothetical protein
MRSADNTWPTRRSTFAKSSISMKLVTPTASASVACCHRRLGCRWPALNFRHDLPLSRRGNTGWTSPIFAPSLSSPHFNCVGSICAGDLRAQLVPDCSTRFRHHRIQQHTQPAQRLCARGTTRAKRLFLVLIFREVPRFRSRDDLVDTCDDGPRRLERSAECKVLEVLNKLIRACSMKVWSSFMCPDGITESQ